MSIIHPSSFSSQNIVELMVVPLTRIVLLLLTSITNRAAKNSSSCWRRVLVVWVSILPLPMSSFCTIVIGMWCPISVMATILKIIQESSSRSPGYGSCSSNWPDKTSICVPVHYRGKCWGTHAGTGGSKASSGSTGYSARTDPGCERFVTWRDTKDLLTLLSLGSCGK